MLRAAVLLLCAVLSAGLLAGPAEARSRDAERPRNERQDTREARPARRSHDGAADAARLAQKRNGGGRVLSVEPMGAAYRVKVLKDGVVRVYVIEDN